MNTMGPDRALSAAQNILVNCASARPGETLLIVHEPPAQGYYGAELLTDIAGAAKHLGLVLELCEVPFDPEVKDPDPILSARIAQADHTLFLARLGDQTRFRASGTSQNQIVSYVLDRDMLSSDFGNLDHRAFVALKRLLDDAVAASAEIHVTCPAGTDFRGSVAGRAAEGGDVTIKRFPMSVFTPVPASDFAGRIAQVGFLVGTGSQYYQPYACELSETLFVEFQGNGITGFHGNAKDVAAARSHYAWVGEKFDIDPYFVHSWHAGIHPGCSFRPAASESFERWTGGAFGNPRLLHFHTCGDYPPGEISLNVVDPTVRIDNISVWDNGKLRPERVAGGASMLDDYPLVKHAFQNPAREIGLGANGRLSFQ